MASAIQTATNAEDLLRIDDPAIPYRFGEIFAGGGWGARRRARQRLQLMKELEKPLGRMLRPGESVVFLCRATRFNLLETWLMGFWASLLNRRAVVVTNERVLLLEIDRRGRLGALASQLHPAAVRRVKGGLGSVQLTLESGDSLRLTQMARADAKRLREILGSRSDRTASPGSAAMGLEHLCPHCRAVVQGFPASCPHCRGAFKSPSRAVWLALLLPGLGEWYLGHRVLGGIQALGALLVWMAVLSSLLVKGDPFAAAIAAGAVFAFGHGLHALAARVAAHKGLYPA